MIRTDAPSLARAAATLLAVAVLACGGGAEGGQRNGGPSDEAKKPLVSLREAPPFALETLDGDSLTLDDLSDRKAILMNFWASWCAPCRAEVPDLIALHEAYEEKGFMVLGVTVNDLPRDSREFVEEMAMTYPSVIGTPAMLESYRLSPWLPTTLLVQDGEVVREWVGPRTREEFEYPVKVALGLAPNLIDVVKPRGRARSGESGPPPWAQPAARPSSAIPAEGERSGAAGEGGAAPDAGSPGGRAPDGARPAGGADGP